MWGGAFYSLCSFDCCLKSCKLYQIGNRMTKCAFNLHCKKTGLWLQNQSCCISRKKRKSYFATRICQSVEWVLMNKDCQPQSANCHQFTMDWSMHTRDEHGLGGPRAARPGSTRPAGRAGLWLAAGRDRGRGRRLAARTFEHFRNNKQIVWTSLQLMWSALQHYDCRYGTRLLAAGNSPIMCPGEGCLNVPVFANKSLINEMRTASCK